MIKKITFLLITIILSVNNLAFSQIDNPYLDFNPEELKNNKNYTKNFNPGNFDQKILYNCMIDMINLARLEYAFVGPLKHNISLDSTAQMQADFQAKKDEKTEFNEPPYRTTYFRLKKFGFTNNGIELVSKAKASLGALEYSYYDLCVELIKPILKNLKQARLLLDKQYTYIGFGYETDTYMRSIYASFILGNDRTFNDGKPSPTEKELPYTKGKGNLQLYDPQICQKCNEDKNLEVLSEYIQVKGNDVYLVCDDHKSLKRLIGKDGDAIVLDFVQHSQYNCDGNVLDNDRAHRGFITKPIIFEKIIAANEIADKKSTKLSAKIAVTPEMMDPNADYDINIIVLKEGKYACRTILRKQIECKNSNYEEKINFLKDLTSTKNAGEWVVTAEEGTLEFKIPFDAKKLDYKWSDFDSLIMQLDAPLYNINKIEIIAQNSLNYANDATQLKNQKRRAETISKALKTQYPNATIVITYTDSWEDFKRDVVNSSEYYDLTLFSKEDAIKKLKENNGQIAKELEKEYLLNHRYANIIFHVTYKVDGDNEQPFVIWKFNKALTDKNLALAMAIENYIMKQVEQKKYSLEAINQLDIPGEKQYQTLLNNKLYMQYFLSKKIDDKFCYQMNNILNLNTANQIINFNTVVCNILYAQFTSVAEIAKLQATLDKLYTFPTLPKGKINSLNLELQFKIIDYLNSISKTPETTILFNSTFDKIKAIRNPKLDSWENAYKLAAFFVKNDDYVYALSLMDPFLSDATISDDFIFSYISIAAHREETYLSNLFTKAVTLAAEKAPARLCGLFDKLPYSVLDNADVKKIICKNCNR